MIEISQKPLNGKKGVILGIANEHSIAYGCAQAFRALGADLAITSRSPTSSRLRDHLPCPVDMQAPGHLDAVLQAINQTWGRLDFPLPRRSSDRKRICTAASPTAHAGFLVAMVVSCHLFIRMARLAEP